MAEKKEAFVKVKALQTGYYGEERRYAGEEFIMKSKDFYAVDKEGKRVVETAIDEDGNEYEAYKTTSWVDLVEDNYNPEKDVVKTVKKQKVRIGPAPADKKEGEGETGDVKPQAFHQPSNPNPVGFAPASTPEPAGGKHHAEPQAAKAKPVKADGHSEKKASDDVI